jgi:membrane associated rhomboid family serine protease
MRSTQELAGHSPFPRWTPAVRWLAIAIAVCFVLEFGLYLARTSSDSAFDWVVLYLGFDPDAWFRSPLFAPAWQLFTYGFLHDARSPWHIVGNLLVLYFFGTSLEERLGSRRLLLTYFVGQVVGALAHLAVHRAGIDLGAAIGASGAVYGVMIALATLTPDRVVYWMFFPMRMKWLAIGIVGFAVFAAILDVKDGPNGVANFVHLGGALYGFVAVRTGLIEKDPVEMLERRRAVQQVERAQSDALRVDQLLDKISRQGIGSLSKAEREFLKSASARK